MRALVAVALSLAWAHASAAEPSHVLIVATAAPLDGERLAESLRAYLDGYDVTVRLGTLAAAGDLRAQLDATRAAGEKAGAFASIRVAAAGASVEIQLADQVTAKVMIASIPRARRDEDLYRAIALKVQSLLRSSLVESAPTLAATAPSLSRLAAIPAATVTARLPSARRLSLD